MVNRIYPPELQLNKANTSDTEAPFLDLHLSVSNGFVSSKIHDKRDDFDFDIVNFPFLDGDVPRSTSYGNWGSTVGFLLLQCFMVLFDTSGISRCRSQHVSVESSSLFHHSIYL